MYSRIREQFSTTALILSIIALVFALGGGAYAASKAQTSKTKVVKGPPGKQGKRGPAGPAGPAGPKGDPGAAGAQGSQGAPGQNGKSVAVTAIEAEEGKCEERAGAEVATEGTSPGVEVCDGEAGKEGSPWTMEGVLPPGKTETGAWAFNATAEMGENISAEISFPIRLQSRFESAEVHFQPPNSAEESVKEAFKAVCPNSVVNPTAAPGNLCVYYNEFGNGLLNATLKEIHVPFTVEEIGTGINGAILQFTYSGGPGETASGFGSWAVTAPTS